MDSIAVHFQKRIAAALWCCEVCGFSQCHPMNILRSALTEKHWYIHFMTISECLEYMKSKVTPPTSICPYGCGRTWRVLTGTLFFTFWNVKAGYCEAQKHLFKGVPVCTERCRKEKYTAGDNEVNIALVVPQCSCFPIKHLFRSVLDVWRNLMGILSCVGFFFKMRKYFSVNFKRWVKPVVAVTVLL